MREAKPTMCLLLCLGSPLIMRLMAAGLCLVSRAVPLALLPPKSKGFGWYDRKGITISAHRRRNSPRDRSAPEPEPVAVEAGAVSCPPLVLPLFRCGLVLTLASLSYPIALDRFEEDRERAPWEGREATE